ncbi:MAG: efflux system, outer rane lipoprotein NodT family [Bryobacterales bacterium]|nr:efflux system, outer rane lipoprotein NodT family [Bryobacterales bacterium]
MTFRSPKYLILISVFCVGCRNIAPRYVKPPLTVPPPQQFQELTGSDEWKTATPSDDLMKGKWWEVFNDPLLSQLEEKVAVDNFNVKVIEAQFRQARAIVLASSANLDPTISTQPSVNQTIRGSNSGRLGFGSSFGLPFLANWEPDLWGRLRTIIEGNTATAQIRAADLENIRLSLQATLALSYFNIQANDMQYALLMDTLNLYEQFLTLTVNRFNGGVASRVDVTLAQTQVYTTQAAATDLQVQRSQLEHAIAVLTGQNPAGFSIPRGRISAPPPPIPVALPSQLLERRPDIAAQERAIAVANATIGLAKIAFYPTLNLSVNTGLTSPSLLSLLSWASRTWSAGPNANQILFDFGRRDAQMTAALAGYDAQVAAYRQVILSAFQQVEDNLSNLRVLAQEAEQQNRAVGSAEQSLNLQTERYKAGTDSYLNVITTQTILLQAQRNAVTLLQRRMQSAVNLILALGGGWDSSVLPTLPQIKDPAMGNPVNTIKVSQPPNTN